MSIDTDLIELGLTRTCHHGRPVLEKTGEMYTVYCRKPVINFGDLCPKHSGDEDIARQDRLAKKRVAIMQREVLENEVLPKATARIMAILADEDSKDSDVIKIWTSVMDRVGLGSVQGLVLEGDLKIDAPLDILRRMLTPPPSDFREVLEAEVVEVHEIEGAR